MMNEKHTPGPWLWNTNRPKKYDLCWLTGPDGARILTMYGDGEITPDKRLIGAAPEMLAALLATNNAKTIHEFAEAEKLRAAAIAKAQGATP